MKNHIAALYIDENGIYPKIGGVDCWGPSRDARLYSGRCPVVAHPPCQLWGRFARINYARWGGEHNRPGNDGGCFASALANVIRCGGVLEHPAYTYAWCAHGLTRPHGIGWSRHSATSWVCEVWQSAYGHRARKRTWLFVSGFKNMPHDLRWERPTGSHQIGFHDQRGKAANKPTLSGRAASATPGEFADALLRLAMISRKPKSGKK